MPAIIALRAIRVPGAALESAGAGQKPAGNTHLPPCAGQLPLCAAIFQPARAKITREPLFSRSRGSTFSLRGHFSVCARHCSVCAAKIGFARGMFHFARMIFRFARAFWRLRGLFSLCAWRSRPGCGFERRPRRETRFGSLQAARRRRNPPARTPAPQLFSTAKNPLHKFPIGAYSA